MRVPTPREACSRQVNVRFDPATRRDLDTLATATDRTLSQLVRYAVTWSASAPTAPSAPDTRPVDGPAQQVRVRFDPALLAVLDTRVEHTGTDRSAVIRSAVRAWLALVDASAFTVPPPPTPSLPLMSALAAAPAATSRAGL
jgi:predicted transcriptional regulator